MGFARWGRTILKKKYQKVPIKIGMSIAIAVGFVFLIFFILGGAAWGNGNAHAKFDWYFLVSFFQNVLTPSSNPHLMVESSNGIDL